MQIDRMFEILYLLLDRDTVKAEELADHFEVCTRTIYRDVDALARAGVPIYTERGRQGGIRLMPGFVLNKSLFTEAERQDILAAVQGMGTMRQEGDGARQKLAALFGGERTDWLQVDFSPWNADKRASQRFELLRSAILARQVVSFSYSGARGGTMRRTVEPVRLLFRGQDWYLLAWCRLREDFRFFKLNRMQDLTLDGATFPPRKPPEDRPLDPPADRMVAITARIGGEMSYRIMDELPPEQFQEGPDGFLLHLRLPDNEWLYQYLLTFGPSLTVLGPPHVREEMVRRLSAALENYREPAPQM